MLDILENEQTSLQIADSMTDRFQSESKEVVSETKASQFALANISVSGAPMTLPQVETRMSAAQSGAVSMTEFTQEKTNELAKDSVQAKVEDVADPRTSTVTEDLDFSADKALTQGDNSFVLGLLKSIGTKSPQTVQELDQLYSPEEAERVKTVLKKISGDLGFDISLDQLRNINAEEHGRAVANDLSNAFSAYYMQELNNSVGWAPESWTDFGKTQDLAQLFFPFITAKTRSDVADIWNVDLVGEDSVQTAVVAFNALPAAQKALLFPLLARGIDEQAAVFGESNIFLTSARLAEFLDPSRLNDGYAEVGLDVAFGAIDVLAFTSFFIKAMKANATIARGPNLFKNFGNKSKAGEVNALALRDDTGRAQTTTATTQDVAAANTAGFNYKKHLNDPVATDDIAAETVAVIEEQERLLLKADLAEATEAAVKGGDVTKVQQIDALAEDLTVTGRGVLRPDERVEAGSLILDNFAEIARRQNLDSDIVAGVNPRIVNETQDGFIIEVTVGKEPTIGSDVMTVTEAGDIVVPDPSIKAITANKPFITKAVEIKVTQDVLTGEFATTTLGLRGSALGVKVLSPSGFLGRLTEAGDDLVSAASAAGLQTGKLRKQFKRMVSVAYRGVSKESKENLNSVLIAGDEFVNALGERVGKVYTREELAEGVATPEGLVRVSSAADQDAYYGVRNLFDITRAKTDEVLVARAMFKGVEQTRLPLASALSPSHTRVAVLPVKSTAGLDIREVLDTVSGKSILFKSKEYTAAIEEGKVLVKVQGEPVTISPIGTSSRKGFNHVLIKEGTTSPITTMLNRHTGYVPVIREGVHFAARTTMRGIVDGVPTSVKAGVRLFDNEREAQIWAAANSTPNRPINVVASDSQGFINTGLSDEVEELQFGGSIFTSPRSSRQILFGTDGSRPTRENVARALDRNLSLVARNMAYNNFRMQSINKWINTARTAWDPKGGGALSEPTDWLSPIRADVPAIVRNGLEVKRDYIKSILNLETPEERFVSRALGDAASYVEATYGNSKFLGKAVPAKLREASLNLRHKDPTAFLRALTFHSLLGAFNPSAGVIQAMGAVPAASLHPVFSAKAFGQYGILRNYFFAEDVIRAAGLGEAFYLKVLNEGFGGLGKVGKAGAEKIGELFNSPEQMRIIIKEMKDTGLLDAVKTQADYAASIQGFGLGLSSWKRLLESGTVFFNEGEMFARGMAYLVARQELGEKMGFVTGKVLTPDQFNAVLDRSRNLTLNLDISNAAKWQTGAIGVPLQFFQITAKTIESMIGVNPGLKGGNTRAKMAGGQMLFFGSRGIPIITAAGITAAVTGMFGEDAMNGLTEEQRIALEGGLASYLIYATTGADVSIASRASLAEGITNTMSALSAERVDMVKAVMGAFGVIPQRTLDAVRKTGWLYSSFDMESPDGITQEKLLFALQEYASVFSSIRNAGLGYALLSDGSGWRNSSGELLLSADDVNTQEAIFQIFGFRPRVADTAYILSMSEQQRKQHQKDAVDAITNAYNFFLDNNESNNNFDEGAGEALAYAVGTILRTVPPNMRTELYKRGFDRAIATDSRTARFVQRYLESQLAGIEVEESLLAPTSTQTMALPKKEK